MAKEAKINCIFAGHYATETPGAPHRLKVRNRRLPCFSCPSWEKRRLFVLFLLEALEELVCIIYRCILVHNCPYCFYHCNRIL
ncbi:MAG: hypothetical protein COT45_03575 [bacterium (Candidatus Stahlbacteria) CG08_land_8_20_14_0_20_40_26]|nr:MAG: hypothetical protein COX49_08345 [bacterium (Candidatus Stahlbacteria) CG23_combo_of_CG06-09_8_20_14_all_40_9]PIS24814.1 MAG: hypothetical protein COT45_03575 [bacterium (Candidatus Stahlbacteria) CG08_land_8_20_14_0_20_40_26]